jgi:predicted dehydrogenase
MGVSFALIGGGRWARVHAGVLCSLYPRISRLLWVSRHSRKAVEGAAIGREHPEIAVFDGIDQCLRERPDAALICTTTANHARDALTVLEHRGIPVLVEKPIALDLRSVRELIDVATRRRVTLRVCLPLLETSYLRRFKSACAGREITSVQIRWFDTAGEMRYGEVKHTDLSTHRVDEVIPHLWSLLDLLIGNLEPQIIATAVAAADDTFLRLRCGDIDVQATFGRRAAERQRCVALTFADGESAQLDFSTEPGVATVGHRRIADDGSWETKPRPLAALHSSFLASADGAKQPAPNPAHIRECLGTVGLAEDIRHRVAEQDAARVAALLRDGGTAADNPALAHLLLDNLGPELASRGLRIGTDETQLRELCDVAMAALPPRGAGADRVPARGRADYRAAIAESAFIRQIRRQWTG